MLIKKNIFMYKEVLIFGSGSIGNHFANAFTKIGRYNILITDISDASLIRMKNIVYPQRYGKWNKKIKQISYQKVFNLNQNFDLVIVGTPPDTHLDLFKKIDKKITFKKILIEKPLVPFNDSFMSIYKGNKNSIFCGYNHSVSESFQYLIDQFKKINKKDIYLIRVNWSEGFKGILNAHFWLKDEFDSYLGNYKRGGGALHEHSHCLHLAICLIRQKFNINDFKISFKKIMKKNNKLEYDSYAAVTFSKKDLKIIIETDLLNNFKTNKSIEVFSKSKDLYWSCSYSKDFDVVISQSKNKNKDFTKKFKKDRTKEFINEIKHIDSIKSFFYNRSFLSESYIMDTMKIIKKFYSFNV